MEGGKQIKGVNMSEALAQKRDDAEQLVLEYIADPRPDLKDLIIVHYATTVEKIARRFSGIESVDDLTQVGYIGLLNALSKFDPTAGVRFNTYATHLIAGEIKHYLRDRSQTIRHPAWLQELRHKVNRTVPVLQAQLGRVPSEAEIAAAVNVTEQTIREVMATQDMLKVASLDATQHDDEDSESDVDRLDAAVGAQEQISVEDRVLLEAAMQQLRDLEREVLVLFHFDSLNQTEIAARLGISCNYVSHVLRQSLAKLRRILTEEEEQDRLLRLNSPESEKNVIDQETGIYNEEYFRARLTEEIHRVCGTDAVVAVILVEFEGLESLGKFYGESSVRDFNVDAAAFLKSSVRALDIVCRNGSNGFGVIMQGTGESVSNAQVRLQKKFEKWMLTRVAPNSPIKLSFGSAFAPDHGRSVADLTKHAILQMSELGSGKQISAA